MTIKINTLFIFFNFLVLFSVQFFFEIGILTQYTGYIDWQLYKGIIVGAIDAPTGLGLSFASFVGFFSSFIPKFEFFLYAFNLLVWVKILSSIQSRFFLDGKWSGLFLTLNPFLYVFVAGIFKETYVFLFVYLLIFRTGLIFRFSLFKDIMAYALSFLVLLIRPHFYPLVVYIYTKSFFMTLVITLFFLFGAYFAFEIDLDFSSRSAQEMVSLGFADIPLIPISDISLIYLQPLNFFISAQFPFFSDSYFVTIYGSFYIVMFLIFAFYNNKVPPGVVFSVVYYSMFFYAFFVVVSGTQLRLFSFLIIVVAAFYKIRTLRYEYVK